MEVRKLHSGLSPSSMALYQSCARKYFYKKIDGRKPDDDVDQDVEALNIGSAFHKVLEDTRHYLKDLSYQTVLKVATDHAVADAAPMIFAMLSHYKAMHEASGLAVVACEVEVETKEFFGIVDVILKDLENNWWIGDMKTASSYNPAALHPTLGRHPQLNLYAFHAAHIGASWGLEPNKYRGCRYRLTTKSKLIRKRDEELGAFIGRVSNVVKSYDFPVLKEAMDPEGIYDLHTRVREEIDISGKLQANFLQNFGNCMQYYRPCDFWSACHGKNCSQMRGA